MDVIYIPARTRTIKFIELARLIADSRYPGGVGESASNHSEWVTCFRWSLLNKLPLDVRNGLLPVWNPICGGPLDIPPDLQGMELLSVADIHVDDLRNYLIENQRITLMFEAEEVPSKPMPQTATNKPLQRFAAQDTEILNAIREMGHDPQACPKNEPGRPGIKAAVRAKLVGMCAIFPKSGAQFDKAWNRLRERREITDKT